MTRRDQYLKKIIILPFEHTYAEKSFDENKLPASFFTAFLVYIMKFEPEKIFKIKTNGVLDIELRALQCVIALHNTNFNDVLREHLVENHNQVFDIRHQGFISLLQDTFQTLSRRMQFAALTDIPVINILNWFFRFEAPFSRCFNPEKSLIEGYSMSHMPSHLTIHINTTDDHVKSTKAQLLNLTVPVDKSREKVLELKFQITINLLKLYQPARNESERESMQEIENYFQAFLKINTHDFLPKVLREARQIEKNSQS